MKFKYEDFTISLNELRELILSYAERKRKYKPKSGIRFTIEDIRKVINRKRKGLSKDKIEILKNAMGCINSKISYTEVRKENRRK